MNPINTMSSTRSTGPFGLPADLWLRYLLFAAIALRILLFFPLSPINNDDHYSVIGHIIRFHELPTSELRRQSYHPPLYYVMAVPFAMIAGVRGVEFLGLLLSVFNLWLLAFMISRTELLETITARRHAMALVALLPQFVLFGLFVSNDTLSYAIGTLFLLVAFVYLESPTLRMSGALGGMLGLGLLTKGTFLAFVPIAPAVVLLSGVRKRLSPTRVFGQVALCLVVATAIGSYKFIENYRHLGRAIVHNQEIPAFANYNQKGTLTGLRSWTNFDLPLLVNDPFDREVVLHSVPMMLYATTWYAYIGEANFRKNRQPRFRPLARLLVLAGIIPTLLGFVGFGRAVGSWKAFARLRELSEADYLTLGKRATAVLLYCSTVAIVIAAGIRYDVWSCFQGRLIFPAIFGMVLMIAAGYEGVTAAWPRTRQWLNAAFIGAYGTFGLYYALEVAGVLRG
jgi:4-amino-4-deoxy-L-arabinose transferase-like glycosyltransferase